MKKLLGLLAATGLVATTGATVVSCGNKEEAFSFGDAFKDFKMKVGDEDKTLALVASTPAKDSAISATSSKAEVATVTVSSAKDTEGTGKFNLVVKAVAKGESTITVKYGEQSKTIKVTVEDKDGETPSPSEKVELNTIITKTTLGDLEFDSKPTDSAIIEAAKKLNTSLISEQVEVKEDSIKEAEATISAKSDSANYTGSVKVTFTKKQTEQKPVLSVDGGNDITFPKSEKKKVVTIKVTNPKAGSAITANASKSEIITVSDVPENDNDGKGTFQITINAVKEGNDTVTVTYGGAENLVLNVTIS
ncbi:hypothetical protein SLITO_v1c09110 [Spiroplasma litorale]|uniref:Lipoprotein n=1 Tax=Spiroplasma litorale TaxID=216942 RepID=A0A0K1W348_9MOLU|nr:lipoprotein [Spiroplasma litorale]AKX34522.1 hypothetical protein SLITO_v1c09110 [Spiroplasma litorale]